MNRRVNLPRYQDSKRNIGYCHVVFATREAANDVGAGQQAMKRDGEFLDRRYLKIELARGGKICESKGG